MKAKFTILIFLIAQLICYADSIYDIQDKRITLKGEFSFKDIISQTGNQLRLNIKLPTSADNQTRKQYDHVITLKMLITEILNNYTQDGIPVDYEYANGTLEFFRTDRIERKVKPRPVYKKTYKKNELANSRNRKEAREKEYLFAQPKEKKENSYPHRADWTVIESKGEKKTSHTTAPTKRYTDLSNNHSNKSSFTVKIPSKKKKIQNNPNPNIYYKKESYIKKVSDVYYKKDPLAEIKTNYTDLAPSIPSSMKNENFSKPKEKSSFRLRITPYPENATAFINDAPSISNYTGAEIYIEWETRMKGAKQQGNKKVLIEEKAELEKRLRWLRSNL